jgi:diadenosine tetraphosphatase ApaH/serine/threonine PP2A family protein phosphatase
VPSRNARNARNARTDNDKEFAGGRLAEPPAKGNANVKYAIVSDVHSNLEALEAVLVRVGHMPLLCLGDLVGYGPQPNECVATVRARAKHVVMGNHDLACADGTGIEQFNPVAMASAAWTNRTLSESNIVYLKSLPFEVWEPTFALVHGSPHFPADFNYVFTHRDARAAFDATSATVTFIGHSHQPNAIALSPDDAITMTRVVAAEHDHVEHRLEPRSRYIVNVGSVGQPRDMDARASYVVYDDCLRTVTWHRVTYDVATVQAKIRATTLPARCAERLATGR